MKKLVSFREAITDPDLLGNSLPGPTWLPWKALLIAAFGEELTNEEREIYRSLTQRDREPMEPVAEFAVVAGRRAGKTRAKSTAVSYISGLAITATALRVARSVGS